MDEVERLIQELRSRSWIGHLRLEVMERLVNLGASAVEPLCRSLEDKDIWVRRHVIEVLEKIGYTQVVETLCRTLADGNEEARRRAAEALVKIDVPALEPLSRLLIDGNRNTRLRAVEVLSNIGRRETLPMLKARLSPLRGERDKNVRAAVRATIEKIEKATEAIKDKPIPAMTAIPGANTLPRPAAAPTHDLDKLPRPTENTV